MEAMKVDHTCVRVKDLEASIAFYQEAFGFEVVDKKDFPDNEFTLCYMALPGSSWRLELTYNYDSDGYDLGNGYGHIGLLVDDVKAIHDQHEEKGYELTDISGLPGMDPFYYFVTDPDGYKIEVIQDGVL